MTEIDPSLVQERTAFSWDRTGLSLMIAGALMIRGSGEGPVVFPVVGVLTVALGVWVVAVANVRYRFLRHADREHIPIARARLVRAVAVCTVVFALTALAWCLAPT